MKAVILAGGNGTRLWPLSRKRFPKQSLRLFSDSSLIQATVQRLSHHIPTKHVFVSTQESMAKELKFQLPMVDNDHFITEPLSMDSSPAIALALIHVAHNSHPDDIIGFFPADAFVSDTAAFTAAMEQAETVIEAHPNTLLLLGIRPTKPHTGFGYIEYTTPLEGGSGYHVLGFKEKPDQATAEEFIAKGTFAWNTGIFIGKIKTLLELYQTYLPNDYEILMEIMHSIGTTQYHSTLATYYPKLTKKSFDYAITEKTSQRSVIIATYEWDDIGDWKALKDNETTEHDDKGNTLRGQIIAVDTRECFIQGTTHRLITTLGLEHLVIIDTDDALLIMPDNRTQEIKKIVEEIKERSLDHYL